MTTAIDQITEQFERKKMIEKRENMFLSELLRLENHLLKAKLEYFHLEKEGIFGCYFNLDNGILPKIIIDSASGDLMFESPVMYRKDHQEINVFFGVNDNKLYVQMKDGEDILIMDHFHQVSKEFITFLCCEECIS